ncbi:MAG: Mut7-C RNAse domain-containing protein [Candidatus Bathyarchaeia archaeon]
MATVKFVADGMCGKICRWLRILGYDVKYAKNALDDTVAEVAVREGRVLLTADDVLYRKARTRGAESILLKDIGEAQRLAAIATKFGIRLAVDTRFSRCPICNFPIASVEADDVKGRIPESTIRFYRDFWICLGCGKIYWAGSHWKNIDRVLADARAIIKGES